MTVDLSSAHVGSAATDRMDVPSSAATTTVAPRTDCGRRAIRIVIIVADASSLDGRGRGKCGRHRRFRQWERQ
jgi:hypothetical protein